MVDKLFFYRSSILVTQWDTVMGNVAEVMQKEEGRSWYRPVEHICVRSAGTCLSGVYSLHISLHMAQPPASCCQKAKIDTVYAMQLVERQSKRCCCFIPRRRQGAIPPRFIRIEIEPPVPLRLSCTIPGPSHHHIVYQVSLAIHLYRRAGSQVVPGNALIPPTDTSSSAEHITVAALAVWKVVAHQVAMSKTVFTSECVGRDPDPGRPWIMLRCWASCSRVAFDSSAIATRPRRRRRYQHEKHQMTGGMLARQYETYRFQSIWHVTRVARRRLPVAIRSMPCLFRHQSI